MFSLQNCDNMEEHTYFNKGCNSSCLTFSSLKTHVMMDEIFHVKIKCKQNIDDACYWLYIREFKMLEKGN